MSFRLISYHNDGKFPLVIRANGNAISKEGEYNLGKWRKSINRGVGENLIRAMTVRGVFS